MQRQKRLASVLLTGATGFLGKVILAELLRRRQELGLGTIYVLIRDKKNSSATERFSKVIASSPCFSRLPKGWEDAISVVPGELTHGDCGIPAALVDNLCEDVNYVVHSAASIEFDLPIAEAAAANITSSLNVLALAQRFKHLKRMVSVSTAYAVPHESDFTPMHERVWRMPRPAEAIYQEILQGTADEAALMRETGHPNTYTYTKCVSENLLMERRGNVPLTLVRPSIISAARRYPMPGWIDSRAAFAGFVALIGMGHLRNVIADPTTSLDVVPCDDVAACVIDSLEAPFNNKFGVRHAVAGLENNCRIDECITTILNFFHDHPVGAAAAIDYIGTRSATFMLNDFRSRELRGFAGQGLMMLSRRPKMARAAQRLRRQLKRMNAIFPYFTQHTFDFRTSFPLSDFDKHAYIEQICAGVYKHLLKQNSAETPMDGIKRRVPGGDIMWALRRPHGKLAIRAAAYSFGKALRRATPQVTFDRQSFADALAKRRDDHMTVVIPSHRSYMDFLLCSYLFFARPDLRIGIPHIAAADDFARIPLVGWILKQTQAFYLKRGIGSEDTQVTSQIHDLVRQKATLQFFIEGARSRTRHFLTPRRGILRCLQKTHQDFYLLPIAISYDRVSEELSFLQHLTTGRSAPMQLRALAGWTRRLVRGEIQLGRIHIRCGEALELNSESDVHEVSRAIVASLQQAMVTSRFHLQCFVQQTQFPDIDVDWLAAAITARGGTVVDSYLCDENVRIDPLLERCMRHHWAHFFLSDALALYPDNEALLHYATTVRYMPTTARLTQVNEKSLQLLLRSLFEPVCRDYALLARTLLELHATDTRQTFTRRELFERAAAQDPTTLEIALEAFVDRKIVQSTNDPQRLQFGPDIALARHFVGDMTKHDSLHTSAA